MSHTEVSSTAVLSQVEARNSNSLNGTEIAGYRLTERLGVGGFGEVWRAVGPGGFSKAVKILFGHVSGPQADTELKSLNRIRDLRHPFLLSIERVEVVDGRVIVVTELADRSLDQRFRELVAAGQRGVNREELLRYLRDAADALDFMSEEHGLQHLDIKPENLLLQGTHAKVGDFGLTKAIGHAQHSQINGFTPLYAPPELFEGRPDRGSDQYSLAIVYQTMLTGIPPFSGRTASQLMAQHLKSSPDLSSLLPSDRAVVARALSKNPRTRFSGCRQFVDELMKRRPTKSLGDRASTGSTAAVVSSSTDLSSTEKITSDHSMLHGSATPLAPVISQPEDGLHRPTLFVGIGGLGCRAVVQLCQRIQQRFPAATLSAVQFLCIDSDSQAIAGLEQSSAGSTRAIKTVPTPLRTTQDYRKESSEHLTWLSRRWLFNIPRSGHVEGLRPLGRLSFVDHAEEIRSVFQTSLATLVNAESNSTFTRETGLALDTNGIDVCLVGSTSGGTSSGCLLDVAWVVRELAMNGRMPPVRVSAMLLHGTAHGRQLADMQDANTVSFLQELQHFSVPGAQRPGRTSRFANSEISKPFDETTLIHLGDDLSDGDFKEGVHRTSEYLELRTVTSARREMYAWRNPERTQQAESHEASLRSFGLSTINAEAWQVASRAAGQLASAVISRWTIPCGTVAEPDSPEWNSLLKQLGLNSEAVPQIIPGLLENGRSRRMDEYATSLWQRLPRESAASPAEQVASIIRQDAVAGTKSPDSVTTLANEVRAELKTRLPRDLQLIAAFLKQFLDLQIRPGLAEQTLDALARRIGQARSACHDQRNDLGAAFNDLCESQKDMNPDQGTKPSHTALRGYCRQYCMLVTCQTICQNVIEHLQEIQSALPQLLEERSRNLRERLNPLASQINGTSAASTAAAIPEQMIAAFEAHLRTSGRFGMNSLPTRAVGPPDAGTLLSEATNFLLLSMSPDPLFAVAARTPQRSDTFPASAKPKLRNVGGGQRVLAVVPDPAATEFWKSMLQREFGACISTCTARAVDVCVICETEGISLPAAIDSLTHMRPHVLELAGRVHSRQDVPW